MTLERIAVATAILSVAVSAGGLLLAWYRGAAQQRPKLARTLAGLTLVSAAGLIVALAFAGGGDGGGEPASARALSAGEYRGRVIRLCEQHQLEAQRIERAEGDQPVFGDTVLIERETTEKLERIRPPRGLQAVHETIVELWGRRVSLLSHYYERFRHEVENPDFRREFQRALVRIDALTRKLHGRFVALGVTPECSLFA